MNFHGGSAAIERAAGKALVECLLEQGVDTVFCVPGESYLTVLDALYDVQDRIRIIVGRHEASVAQMAEAYGKLTGKPGICFVTRGPGASHASIAVHTAFHDATPLILFVGQVGRDQLERMAFQEMDYRGLFSSTSKWVTEITDAQRVPELVSRAFSVAMSGKQGPVVLSLPEDMQDDPCSAPVPARYMVPSAAPGQAALGQLQSMLEKARRPILILGGSGWSPASVVRMRNFAEAFGLPVVTGFRRQDLFDNDHPNYIGDLGIAPDKALVSQIQDADLLLVVGERLGEITSSSFTVFRHPKMDQALIHVHSGAEELGLLYRADLAINATAEGFSEAVSGLVPRRSAELSEWVARGRSAYEVHSVPPVEGHPRIDVARIIKEMSDRLPSDAIITNGAGLYTAFVHRFYQFRDYGSQLAPTTGAMGYGLPAAIAAKVVHPDRPAVCIAGDGCFMMAAQELATAVMFNLNLIVLVIDNSSYGSIRHHQEKYYPGRVVATDLLSPDFVALAKAFGAHAERIEETGHFEAAFERALNCGRPALLTFRQDIGEVVNIQPQTEQVLDSETAA